MNKEKEQSPEPTIEWYKAQVEELKDIRGIFWEKFGDMTNGYDAYFPDLVSKKIEELESRVITKSSYDNIDPK